MEWFGLGRPRTKFGKWIEQKGLRQQDIADSSGVPRPTISDLARDDSRRPSYRTRRKLDKALRDEGFDSRDFWGR
ncbi:MAG: helix-turn-helix domain-containing protein [Alicyclobacillus sp.]|nr:helix-turn-helix domain-containing protein [Alicyclobacillus sp.]